ncbi:MAG: hypothetical protein KC416_06175, partial [Myxococcales bacterium]|nr:hypothetical protein [Myxococcales bacterium]
ARKQIQELYGKEYVPNAPRTYAKKVKNAQEAHEAIRPAGDSFRKPESVAADVGLDEARLYEMIWKRTIASQMEDAKGQRVSVRIRATTSFGEAEFSTSGNTISFPGFLRAYVEGSDDPAAELGDKEKYLPQLEEGQAPKGKAFEAQSHETQPPARFTEASLVRRLEELGVGRPSTYASTVSTILDRGYVWKKGTALVPSFKAFAVISLLEQHFGHLVDYAFTAKMEDELDEIASGQQNATPWLSRFYFGSGGPDGKGGAAADGPNGKTTNGSNGGIHTDIGLHAMVSDHLDKIDARAINTLPVGKSDDGEEICIRVGRYGPYLQCGEATVSIPENTAPDEMTLDKAKELLSAPTGDVSLGDDPETGLPVYLKQGRYGAYVQLGDMEEGEEKPKTSSLLKDQKPEDITFEGALKLLSLPRVVGKDPSDGEEIIANNGRYGAYITKGTENRSLERDEQLFTVTVEEALAILAKPKERRRRAAAPPLKELGNDPVSGQPITLRHGRFGNYVTDGETNASLRAQDDPDSITPERAHELLQLRREAGPSTKKKKAPKKKAAKKKATKKKASKKKAPKKKAAPKKA